MPYNYSKCLKTLKQINDIYRKLIITTFCFAVKVMKNFPSSKITGNYYFSVKWTILVSINVNEKYILILPIMKKQIYRSLVKY